MPVPQIVEGPLFKSDEPQPGLTDDQAHLAIASILHEKMLEDTSHLQSLRLDSKVLAHEVIDHEHKLRALGATAVTLVTQAADRFRLLVPIVVTAARKTYEHTNEFMPTGTASLLAGGVAGATFGLWAMGVGEPLNRSIRMLPKTVENVGKTFPGLVAAAENILPGMKEEENQAEIVDIGPQTVSRRINTVGKAAGRFIGKGFVAINFGSTAYTLTSIARGDSREVTTSINRNAAKVGGVVLGGLATLLIGTADGLAHNGQEGAAQWIDEWVIKNNYLWYGLAFGSLALSFIASKFKKEEEPFFYQLDEPTFTSETPIQDESTKTIRAKLKDGPRNAIEKLKVLVHRERN